MIDEFYFSSMEDLKKLDNIYREGLRIYTGAFRTSPVQVLHVEANNPSLEIRKNELWLIFMDKKLFQLLAKVKNMFINSKIHDVMKIIYQKIQGVVEKILDFSVGFLGILLAILCQLK